jgi:hypothetical protein
MKLCDYGCGQEAKFQFKNEKWCCSEHYNSCPEKRRKNSETSKGQIPWSKGKKGIHSIEGLKNISEKNKAKVVTSETKKKMSESQKIRNKKYTNPMIGRNHSEESKEKMSKNRKPGFVPSNKGKKDYIINQKKNGKEVDNIV